MTVQVLGEPIAQAVPERMRERPVPVRAQRPQLVGDALVVAGGVAERESPNEAPPGLHEIRSVEFTARPRMLEQILRLLLDHGNPFGRETVQGVFRFEDRLVERASLGADVPREMSTPLGWNGLSAATFSLLAAVNDAVSVRRIRSTSSGVRTIARVRPGIGTTTGPSPCRFRRSATRRTTPHRIGSSRAASSPNADERSVPPPRTARPPAEEPSGVGRRNGRGRCRHRCSRRRRGRTCEGFPSGAHPNVRPDPQREITATPERAGLHGPRTEARLRTACNCLQGAQTVGAAVTTTRPDFPCALFSARLLAARAPCRPLPSAHRTDRHDRRKTLRRCGSEHRRRQRGANPRIQRDAKVVASLFLPSTPPTHRRREVTHRTFRR